MKLHINGEPVMVQSTTLAELIEELDHDPNTIATAVNQVFVPRSQRTDCALNENDAVEIIAPMSGG